MRLSTDAHTEASDDRKDVSRSELQLQKLDLRDKTFKTFIIAILLTTVGLGVFATIQVRQLSKTTASSVEQHRYQVETANKATQDQLKAAALANRARLDVNLCIVSVPPQTRTPEYVKNCYEQVEKQLDIKIQRFGFGNE